MRVESNRASDSLSSFLFRPKAAKATALVAAVAAAVAGRVASAANIELDVPNGTTDLTSLGAGTSSDLTFTAINYSPAAFTVGSSLAIGTLDVKATNVLTISNSGGASATTLTLSTAANAVSGTAGDLLYVASGSSLTVAGGSGSSALGVALGVSGNFNVAGTASISSGISGTGFGITKTGVGTLVLGGSNSYTGATALNIGTLQLTNTGALTSSALTVANNTRLDLRSDSAATFATGGTTLNGGTINVDGISGGTGQTLTLGGATAFTGGSTVNITSASGDTLAFGTISVSGANATNTLNAVGANVTISQFNGSGGGDQPLVLGGNGNFTFGTLTNGGANREINPTINTSGTVTINGSTASNINNDTSNGNNATVSLNNGTLFLDFSNLATPSNLITRSGTHATTFFAFGGGTLSINGKSGSVATSQNLFGGTTFNPGASAIVLTNNGTSATAALNAITRTVGGTVDFSAGASTTFGTTGLVTTTTTTNTNGILGGYATVGGSTWAVAPGTSGQAITGLATASYSNTASTALSGAATTANVDIAAAGSNASSASQVVNSLRFNDATGSANVDATNGLVLTTGGILVTSTVGGNATSITGGTLQGAASNDLVVIQNNTSAALTIGSTIADNTAATALTKSGAGVLKLTNSANTFTGKTYLNAGTLNIAADASLGVAPGSVTATQLNISGGTLQFAGSFNLATNRGITLGVKGGAIDTNSFTSTYAGVIAGTSTTNGALTKTGAGQLTLTGPNTYAGGTVVSGGTLMAGNASALGTGSVIVNGGTLSSSVASLNTLAGLTLSSGLLTPQGSSVGTFALSANRSFTMTGGTFNATITGTTTFDKITGSGLGNFAITGGILDLSSSTSIDYTKTYALLSGFAGGSVAGLTISGYDTANYAASLNNAGVLSFAAVPEPASLAMLGMAAFGMVARRRRSSH